ncbi:tetratricopeptide repeat protein [Lutimonas sp.]|uniref:tetratricopeptide repeat protein n=1 Tax=Lutimonas sp. TaxID=1872403 RepID=UPI003D9B679E
MKIITYIALISVTLGFAQDKNDEKLLAVSNDACECISQIDTESDDKNLGIKDCINKSLDAKIVDESSAENKVVEMNYKTVENYLVQHCKSLKELAFTENKKFKHASSDNVLAQLAYDDGMEYINEDDIENAIIKFTKAVEIDPNFAFAWDNLGISYRKNSEYEKAIASYKKSLEIYPEGRLPLLNIAITYNLNKQYDEAVTYYNKFIDIYKEDPEGYYGLGLILYTQQQEEAGLDNLIRAYTIYTAQNSPYRADAAKKIGYMYKDLKNQDRLEVFQKVADKYNLKVQNN